MVISLLFVLLAVGGWNRRIQRLNANMRSPVDYAPPVEQDAVNNLSQEEDRVEDAIDMDAINNLELEDIEVYDGQNVNAEPSSVEQAKENLEKRKKRDQESEELKVNVEDEMGNEQVPLRPMNPMEGGNGEGPILQRH